MSFPDLIELSGSGFRIVIGSPGMAGFGSLGVARIVNTLSKFNLSISGLLKTMRTLTAFPDCNTTIFSESRFVNSHPSALCGPKRKGNFSLGVCPLGRKPRQYLFSELKLRGECISLMRTFVGNLPVMSHLVSVDYHCGVFNKPMDYGGLNGYVCFDTSFQCHFHFPQLVNDVLHNLFSNPMSLWMHRH